MKHSRGRARRRLQRHSELIGAAVRCAAFMLLVVACVVALRWVSSNPHSYSIATSSKSQNFEFSNGTPSYGIQSRNRRLVYPYSVIPGGVRSAAELREIAVHDPVVAAHYSGFDYARAHVIQVDHPKMVYVSYRRGGQVHWTRKQAMLRVGEMLLTDGHITARTRCGNQVSVLPQANVLPEEPTMAELERPDVMASGSEQMFPQSSTLLNLDPFMAIAPPFAGAPQPGGFVPVPIGGGGVGSPSPLCPTDNTGKQLNSSKECNHQPPPPSTVPEPGTMVLFFSGAAAMYARFRLHKA